MATKTKSLSSTIQKAEAKANKEGLTGKSFHVAVGYQAMGAIAFNLKSIKPLDSQAADLAIAKLAKAGMSVRKIAHETACGIILHWQAHGDYTKLTKLFFTVEEVMSKAMARGLAEWAKEFSGGQLFFFENDPERGQEKIRQFRQKKGANREFNMTGDAQAEENTNARTGAFAVPFYSGSFGDKPVHQFDFDVYMQKVVDTIQREVLRLAEPKKGDKININMDKANSVLETAKGMGFIPKAIEASTATAGTG